MSVAEIYETVIRNLSEHDQRELVATIRHRLDRSGDQKPRITWRQMRGRIPVNSMGEDAQDWVSRTRREAGERRDRSIDRTR